jgi:rare lipoprotein A
MAVADNNMTRISRGIACLVILFALQACSAVPEKRVSNWKGYTESGKASYYAMKFHSRKTASGELYDNAKKTAAHKKLPFGTKIKVTNKKNGKSVIVKINDRGPFVKGRIVDLSRAAFSSIADLNAGIIEVKIEISDPQQRWGDEQDPSKGP